MLTQEKRVALNPCIENEDELKSIEGHRRKLMRLVPSGWDWREDIYCLHSQTEFVNSTINELQVCFDEES
jgi:hypothetical protein